LKLSDIVSWTSELTKQLEAITSCVRVVLKHIVADDAWFIAKKKPPKKDGMIV